MLREKGFTLLDLMTSLAVVTILVTVAVPGLQSITASSRQSGSTNDLIAAMHVARSTAVTRNQRVTVCASVDGEACGGEWQDGFIVFSDDDSDQVVDADDVIVGRGGESKHLTIKPKTIGAAVTFRTNGRTTLPAVGTTVGLFSFCDSRGAAHARGFAIDISGLPRPIPEGDASLSC